MAGIPGGMESSDDEDGDFMCYNFSERNNEDFQRKVTDEGNLRPKEAINTTSDTSNHSDNFTKQQNGCPGRPTPKPPVYNSKVQNRQTLQNSVAVDDLRMAAVSGNLEKVQELLENGLYVDIVLKSHWTCLMYACSCGHLPIVKYLLEKKADPNYQKDLFTPLLAVCASRQDKEEELLKCLQVLLEYGAKANVWDRQHMTALMYCARENRVSMLKEILAHNVEVDRQDNRGWTALFWAASNGHGQSVRILLENGTDPSKVASDGQNAADVAYAQKYEEIAEILQRVHSENTTQLKDSEKDSLLKSHRNQRRLALENDKSNRKPFTVYGELEMFLSGLNLKEYIPIFQDHQISFFDFLLLSEEDLEKMGINKVGVRKNILEGIKTVHSKKWEKTSLPNLRKQQYISCPDAVAVMANISTHLRYIKSTIRYLRNEIQKTPRILELGQEAANVHKLLEESEECLRSEKVLCDELRFFKMYLVKVQDQSEYQPADFIVETVPDQKQKICKLSSVAVLSITVVVGLLVWKKPRYLARLVIFPQKWHWMLS